MGKLNGMGRGEERVRSPSPRKRKAKKKDDLEGWYGEGGGRGFQDWEQVSVHPRRIHDDIWQNQYNIVK